MSEVRPKKALGQHFLTDLSVSRRIADSLLAEERTDVLEVGPGMGVLTNFLLARPEIALMAVKIDQYLINF